MRTSVGVDFDRRRQLSDKETRLVLRRTNIPKGNKILVRLDHAIDRSIDLDSLFRDGVVIEVLDIDAGDDTRPPLADDMCKGTEN